VTVKALKETKMKVPLRVSHAAGRTLLIAAVFFCFAVISRAQYSTTLSPSSSAQSSATTSAANQIQGSVPGKLVPGTLRLSLEDAIDLGLKQNLGALLSSAGIQFANGERWEQLSALLPHVSAAPSIDVSKVNLAELGFTSLGGIALPNSIGPFSYFDVRASVNQSLFDWKSINATRAAGESVKSAEHSYKDARDLVVLAVGLNYLQAVADEARIETAQAQVKTAQALFDQATAQVDAGSSASIDGLRAKVELQTRQQQLIQTRNNFAIQKLTLARVIGLAPGQEFDLTDKALYSPFEGVTLDDALKRAYISRSDYQAALADLRAAEFTRKAAVAGYLPSLSLSADYGVGGAHPSNATQVSDVRGTISIPIFQGGSVHGDILQANAKLEQSRDRLENLRGQIDADVRTALLNLQSSADQVSVARSNVDLAEETLSQSRDRFASGVVDTVEVVQSQELVASAHEQYISSLYNFNFAKISLARSMGVAETGVKEYFKGK
jgi:outer membrane protein TolC